MSNVRASDALRRLEQSASGRRGEANKLEKTRVVVQVGHCSESVGAREVAETLAQSLPDSAYLVTAGCDGACFAAPQVVTTNPAGVLHRFARVTPESARGIAGGSLAGADDNASFFAGQRRIALGLCGELDSTDIDDYIAHGGYSGLARALERAPDWSIEAVQESGLRGKGGAYFPVAAKWRGARSVESASRYLVVNCEEGEPGIFKDRHLMEGVPHRIVEGATIAAYAAGVAKAYVYINAEADLSAERMWLAVQQAYDRNLLGNDILGSGFGLTMEIRRGAGGYICGDETTLLNTIEGRRREPRLRPPFPTESGLWAEPTVINNAESLASVPFILAEGAGAYAAIGTDEDSGTKIVSISGSVRRPGVAELAMGTTLRQIVYDIGGGPAPGRTLTALAVGGPSSGVLPVSMLNTPIRPGALHDSGVMLGAGGVVALDERAPTLEIVRILAAYNAAESCGKCAPCREGTPRMVEVLDRIISKGGSPADRDELKYLAHVIGAASLCGLGQAAGGPITSGLHFFEEEMAMKVGAEYAGGGSIVGVAKARMLSQKHIDTSFNPPTR